MKFLLFLTTAFFSLSVSANCPGTGPTSTVESSGGLCTGSRVISDNGHAGTVSAIFGGGSDVMVKFDGYSTNNKWPSDRLARTYGCSRERFCVNEIIISDNGHRGTIAGILVNGEVMIRFDGYSTYNKWPTSKLSRTRGCTRDGYCMEDIVVSDNGHKGSIKAISKSKGQVQVKFDGYSTFNQWPTQRLGITDACQDRPRYGSRRPNDFEK